MTGFWTALLSSAIPAAVFGLIIAGNRFPVHAPAEGQGLIRGGVVSI